MVDFPNVPPYPGVPPLPRSGPTSPPDPPPLDEADTYEATDAPGPQWGVFYDDGTPLVVADGVKSLDYDKGYNTPTYPIEGGGFATYNKVEEPYRAHVELTKGGTEADRQAFLTTLENAASLTETYSVVTPTFTYRNASLNMLGYRRSADAGAQLLTVELKLDEIRQGVTEAFSNTRQPEGQTKVDNGAVEGKSPTPAQVKASGTGPQ